MDLITVDWKCGILRQPSIVVGVEMCQKVGRDALNFSITKCIDDKLCACTKKWKMKQC